MRGWLVPLLIFMGAVFPTEAGRNRGCHTVWGSKYGRMKLQSQNVTSLPHHMF